MENVKSFFDSFKEFIWDIIGYLVPGSYILILLSFCVNHDYYIRSSLEVGLENFSTIAFVISSYILGYLTHGVGCLKEKLLGKYSYTKKIESRVSTRKAYILSKELLSKVFKENGITEDLGNSTVRDLRSIAMSFIPEHDHKIYTFTFRSDLSSQAGNISFIIGFLGLISTAIPKNIMEIFLVDKAHLLIYICLIISYLFFRETRNRFYNISISVPFSIYSAVAIRQ